MCVLLVRSVSGVSRGCSVDDLSALMQRLKRSMKSILAVRKMAR
jgi:hypothetical protein